jgi:hypothetical protein
MPKQQIPTRSSFSYTAAVVFLVAFAAAFALLPMPGGDDWETFHGAGQRILHGEPLYGSLVTHAYYSNPPWVAALLAPISLLPVRWGWGLLAGGTLLVSVFLVAKYAPGKLKFIFFLLSPPVIYTLLHGQIDVLILAGVLLPREWWPLAAVSKPQVAVGLALGVPRNRLLRAGLLGAAVLLASWLLFGPWPLELLRQPTPFQEMTHNLWLGLWPFQAPLGIALLALGLERKDERFLFSASPFLMPYAAISSLVGPWLAGLSFLKDWQAGVVFVAWWGAVLYRALGGA